MDCCYGKSSLYLGVDYTENGRLAHIVVLARDAFVRMNHRAIAMMFVRPSVRLSVCPSGTGVHCDYTVQFSADSSLWLDSPMFLSS